VLGFKRRVSRPYCVEGEKSSERTAQIIVRGNLVKEKAGDWSRKGSHRVLLRSWGDEDTYARLLYLKKGVTPKD